MSSLGCRAQHKLNIVVSKEGRMKDEMRLGLWFNFYMAVFWRQDRSNGRLLKLQISPLPLVFNVQAHYSFHDACNDQLHVVHHINAHSFIWKLCSVTVLCRAG